MAQEMQRVNLQKIYLDNENSRHDPIDNETDIIKYLLAKEKVGSLAKDIAKWGLSPLERMAVVPHSELKSAYTVAEGNRRLCALKLLHDPDKAPNEATKRLFRAYASQMSKPLTAIDIVVFPDMRQAAHWLELRHDGAQDGAAARPWSAKARDRAARRSGKESNPNMQAGLLLDYAAKRNLITEDEHDGISITTLTRFLTNAVVRETLGLATGKTLDIHVPQDELHG